MKRFTVLILCLFAPMAYADEPQLLATCTIDGQFEPGDIRYYNQDDKLYVSVQSGGFVNQTVYVEAVEVQHQRNGETCVAELKTQPNQEHEYINMTMNIAEQKYQISEYNLKSTLLWITTAGVSPQGPQIESVDVNANPIRCEFDEKFKELLSVCTP